VLLELTLFSLFSLSLLSSSSDVLTLSLTHCASLCAHSLLRPTSVVLSSPSVSLSALVHFPTTRARQYNKEVEVPRSLRSGGLEVSEVSGIPLPRSPGGSRGSITTSNGTLLGPVLYGS